MSSAGSSVSSGSRTRGERAARGSPRARSDAVRGRVAGDGGARRARRGRDQARGPSRRGSVSGPGDGARRRRIGPVHVAELREAERGAGLPGAHRGGDHRSTARVVGLPRRERPPRKSRRIRVGLGLRAHPPSVDRLRIHLRLRRRRSRRGEGRVRPHPAGGERHHERHGEPRVGPGEGRRARARRRRGAELRPGLLGGPHRTSPNRRGTSRLLVAPRVRTGELGHARRELLRVRARAGAPGDPLADVRSLRRVPHGRRMDRPGRRRVGGSVGAVLRRLRARGADARCPLRRQRGPGREPGRPHGALRAGPDATRQRVLVGAAGGRGCPGRGGAGHR